MKPRFALQDFLLLARRVLRDTTSEPAWSRGLLFDAVEQRSPMGALTILLALGDSKALIELPTYSV